MVNKKIKMASQEVVEERKRGAGNAAANFGHNIGGWQFEDGSHPVWVGHCSNKKCHATMRMNPAVNGIAVGIATNPLAECPYIRQKIFSTK